MNLRRCFRVVFSPGFGGELKALTRLAWPTTVASVLEFVMWMMPIIFCGHLGKIQLDAVTLALSVVNVTGISLGFGLGTACDTLMAQTFGSDNKMRVGIILQRSILILLLCCFPCWSLYMNTEKLLLLIHQDPEVARLAGEFVTLFIPALPGVFLFLLETKYLSTQGIVYPAMFINLAVNILNVPANYLCILYFRWGIRGAAIATGATQYLLCFFMFLYIRVRKLHLQTWPGWRSDCLQEWGVYVKLAVAGLLMVCLEWWTYEIGTLLTGLIGTLDLAAQGIIITINSLNYMVPMAMGVAASIRVGNELGAGNAAQAKLAAKVSIFSFCCYAFVASIVLLSSRHVLGYVFSSDEEVVSLIGEVLPIVCVTQLADSVQAGCAGILRGCGKQKLGAIITFIGFYVLGLPFVGLFMFGLHLGVKGMYFGLGIATIFQCVCFLITIARMDWEQETLKAQGMAGVKAKEEASHCNDSIQGEGTAKELDREDSFPNGSLGRAGAQELQSVTATFEDSTHSQNSLVHKFTEQETDFTTMLPPNGELSEMQEADSQYFSEETGSTDIEPLLDMSDETHEVMVLSLEKLPFKVMLCRRLLAVAACLAILTVGVVVREFVPNPDYSYPPDCITWTANGSLPLNTTLPWCNTTVTNTLSSVVPTLHPFSAGRRVWPEETTTTTTVTSKASTFLDVVVSRSLRVFSHHSKNSTFFFKTSFT